MVSDDGEEALRGMESSHGGLSSGQAEVRCGQFGENVLQEHAGKKIWQVFLEQFQDLLVLILIVAAAISVLSGSGESAAVIFAVITMNAVLGTIQHEKARKSLESLKKLSAPVAQVLRDGKSQEIPAAKVVPGDIVLLDAGSLVAADGRLLECYNLQVNESSLTGESLPVEKRAGVEDVAGIPLGDQYNMVFAGSLVTGGRGVFVVTATGMETELGKIARLMNMAKEKKTPLQVSLDQFSTHLAALILGICVLVFGLSLYRGTSVLESLMFAVALAVAAIPEALGSIVTIVQAMGTQQMAREHAIIKDLKAVESLGCVSVICSDKTGTLTQNRMTVEQVLVDGRVLQPGQLRLYDPVQRYFLYGAVLDNDAVVQGDVCTGDPTETALLAMALRADVSPEALRREMPRLGELPFDSGRKRMSTLHWCDGICVLFTKGAPDVLLERTDQILTKSGVRPMTPEQKKQIRQQNESWAAGGLRVLGSGLPASGADAGLQPGTGGFLYFPGHSCYAGSAAAGVETGGADGKKGGHPSVMITGDHPVTALAVAEKTGILGGR